MLNKRGKVIIAVALVVVLAASLIACAAPAPAPTPTPATQRPIGEIPVVPAGEVYEWTLFSIGGPEQDAVASTVYNEIIPGLEAVTNGRLKIDWLSPGEHPYKTGDVIPALGEGKCDIAYASYPSASYADPRFGAADLPFLQPSGGYSVKKDMHRLLSPVFADILADWNIFELAHGYNPPQQFWHASKWLENIDSMKGERIRTWCPELDGVVEMLGGTPIRIDPAEAYTSLQTGLVDGLITGVVFCVRSKLVEVVKVYQPLDVFQTTLVVLVNQDSWNELPPEIQDAVLAYIELRKWYIADAEMREEPARLQEAVDEYGLQIGAAPAELRDQLVARSYEGVWKPWAERVGSGSLEFLDMIVNRIEAAGYKVPGYPSH